MWPGIIRDENKKGIQFDPDFWEDWGPTEVKYSDNRANKKRKIQSIYCIYDSFDRIQIDDINSIAFALEYECGDFGRHSVFFSYDKTPKITYPECWEYLVFKDFDSDDKYEILLYQLGVMDIETLSECQKVKLGMECFNKEIINNIQYLEPQIRKLQEKRVENDLDSILEYCREQLSKKASEVVVPTTDPNEQKMKEELNRALFGRFDEGKGKRTSDSER